MIDLNKDGVPDVVFGSTASTSGGLTEVGFLRALNGDDGSEIFTLNQTSPVDLRIAATCSVATGDIDLDGCPEVVAGNTVYDASGAIEWQASLLPDGYNAVANFDDDDQAEIVLVANSRVYLFEHDGALK